MEFCSSASNSPILKEINLENEIKIKEATPTSRKSIDNVRKNVTPLSLEKPKRIRYSLESLKTSPLRHVKQSTGFISTSTPHVQLKQSTCVVGNGIDDIAFSPHFQHNSSLNMSINDTFHKKIWLKSEKLYPYNDRKGSIAVMYVEAKSYKIKTCNDKACELLETTENELIGSNINKILTNLQQTSKTIVHLKTFQTETELSVCLWTRKVPDGYLVMMEKITCLNGTMTLDRNNSIMEVGNEIAILCGSEQEGLIGCDIKLFFPFFQNKKTEQFICGISDKGLIFPAKVESLNRLDENQNKSYNVQAFLYISGVISVNSDGNIVNVNNHLASILLGYENASKLHGISINEIMPELTDDGQCSINDSYYENVDSLTDRIDECLSVKDGAYKSFEIDDQLPQKRKVLIEEGNFGGYVQHFDSSYLPIMYDVEKTEEGGLWLIWISYSQIPTVSFSEMESSKYSVIEDVDDMKGTFSNKFETDVKFQDKYDLIEQIGKGAFGYVFVAKQLSSDCKVIVKKIKKAKVLKKGWTTNSNGVRIPIEIDVLLRLTHAGIVKALEAFESEKYYELIMKRHGNGMDMFELIEQASIFTGKSGLDELLAAYMFRQLSSGVAYLHDEKIAHRDIKDENIIVDTLDWSIKLIDFGSAVTLISGKTFGSFCGTMEYCSPEVLLGNRYKGPELDVFSMGVTLFTMLFGENPFCNAEETIECIVRPPIPCANLLLDLLFKLLTPDPDKRLSAKEAVAHKWCNQKINLEEYDAETIIGKFVFRGNTAGDFRKDSQKMSTPISEIKEPFPTVELQKENCCKELFNTSF